MSGGRRAWMVGIAHLIAALACVACGGDFAAPSGPAAGKPAGPAVTSLRYEFAPDPTLSRLDVRACFDGRPGALVQEDPDARLIVEPVGPELAFEHGRLAVRSLDAEGCVRYRVAVDRAAALDHPLRARVGRDALLGAPLWLWGPEPHAPAARGELGLVPTGVDVVTPWAPRGRGYALEPVSFVFDAAVVFGDPLRWTMETQGAELAVVRMNGPDGPSDEALRGWLRSAAAAAATLFGQFPVPRAMMVVVPVDGVERPVAAGHTYRGGGASVVFRVSRNATHEDLVRDDWVAVHEMAHLGMPYVRHRDAWLSEGFATYYQEVLRARVDLQKPLEAWQTLYDGLRWARKEAAGQTLAELASRMRGRGEVPAVYWGGAALALSIDVELRRRGLGTLDALVRGLHECCAWPPRDWPAAELVARMDALAGKPVVSTIARRWLHAKRLPDMAETWRWLGLEPDADGRLQVRAGAPGAKVRDAIVAQ